MFELNYTGQFKRDLKLLKKRSQKQFAELQEFVVKLQQSGFEGIDKKHRPHYLSGKYIDCCECHVMSDLLLIWIEDAASLTITLIRTVSHSDLF